MIKINLIPPEILEKRKQAQYRIRIYIFSLLLILGVVVFTVFQFQRRHKIETEIIKVNKTIAELKPFLKKAEALKEEVKNMDETINSLGNLIKDQFFWSYILDELANLLPDNVWLKRLSLERKGNIRIRGTVILAQRGDIYDFVPRLDNSLYFTKVSPPTTTLSTGGGQQTVDFTINCEYKKVER